MVILVLKLFELFQKFHDFLSTEMAVKKFSSKNSFPIMKGYNLQLSWKTCFISIIELQESSNMYEVNYCNGIITSSISTCIVYTKKNRLVAACCNYEFSLWNMYSGECLYYRVHAKDECRMCLDSWWCIFHDVLQCVDEHNQYDKNGCTPKCK